LNRATGDWVLLLDADERVTPELADEIKAVVQERNSAAVYAIKRLTYFFGKRLRFSGTGNDYPLRLFPRGSVHYEKPVHEEVVTTLPTKRLVHPMIHYSTRNYAHYKQKMACYIPLERKWQKQQGSVVAAPFRRWVQPLAKFFHLYILRLGLLDGITGLQYAALSSYYDFSKYSGDL